METDKNDNMRDLENYSLLAHNTFGVDAHCRRFLEYATIEEAQQVAQMLRESDLPYIIIGGGSNLLLTRDYEGIVVHSAIKGCSFEGTNMLCGSGEVWDEVVVRSLEHELYGLENLSIIPGDVGASAVQNIGAYGMEAAALISKIYAVEIATGQKCVISAEDCHYGYRDSRFKREWKNRYLITGVEYSLSKTFSPRLDYGNITTELERRGIVSPTAQQVREVIVDLRNSKLPDPKVIGNGGSFFMNPIVPQTQYEALALKYPNMPHYPVDEGHVKIPAGWMIEQCGWKGKSLGRAGVYEKQALVLVNRGGATGQEVVALSQTIINDVKEKFGIEIHPEVNII